jgi:hypothetical protein
VLAGQRSSQSTTRPILASFPRRPAVCFAPNRALDLLARFHAYATAPVVAPVVIIPAERKRLALSVRVRYAILDRDAHTCRYCGRSSPVVTLHVDHVISQSSWRERFGSWTAWQVTETTFHNNHINSTDKMFGAGDFPEIYGLIFLQRKSNLPAEESSLRPSRDSATRIENCIGEILTTSNTGRVRGNAGLARGIRPISE